MRTLATVSTVLCCCLLNAQVATGDIAVTGFSTNAFGVIVAGPSVTGYATPGFQGTGLATSQAILWDRTVPNAFLVAGFGFVGRATIAAPGIVGYQVVTNNVGIVSQMSWHDSGLVVFVDSGTGQVRFLDPVGGAVFDLTTGPQPWGSDLASGAWDPTTGDVVVGGNGAIWRVNTATLAVTPVASGLGGFVSGIAFDPSTGEAVATVLTANKFVRISAAGVVSNISPMGSVPGPNAVAVDPAGNFVVGGGTGQVYRVPRAGGAPVFLASNTSPANAVNGLAVAGGGGLGVPFGTPCNGTAGPANLAATGPFLVASNVVTTSTNHAANAIGALVLGLSRTFHWSGAPLPILLDPIFGTSGCLLHVSDDILLLGIAGGSAPADLTISLQVAPVVSGLTFYAQHVCLEPVAGDLSWSNGLLLHVP